MRAASETDTSKRPGTGAGRFEQWRAGWRVALRMARRDVRRHRGRSSLVLVMIGFPVLLIAFGATFGFTGSIDDVESAPYVYGPGQALVRGPVVQKQLDQDALGHSWGYSDNARSAAPIPGLDADSATAMSTLVGGTAVPLVENYVRVEVDGRKTSVSALGVDLPADADLGQRAHLVTGRWPVTDDEVVVTTWGAGQGLPTSGEIRIDASNVGGELKPRKVVGVADAVTGGQGSVSPASVVLRPWADEETWLVVGRGPVTWDEVRRLNTHGLIVMSRSFVGLPDDELPQNPTMGNATGDDPALAVAIAGIMAGLLFTTTLLAGPAFAVSASRQRRTLALSAANGASRAQVRRTILAQAVVLGGLATAVGISVGVGLFLALKPWLARNVDERLVFAADVPWGFLAAVAGAALVSAVVAALLPARTLGKLDIVRAMRGQEVARPVRHRLTAVGVLLLLTGGVLTLTQVNVDDGMQQAGFGLIGGSALLTVGALLVVPALLVASARLAHRFPVSVRMAARDSARQRARTGPTVAAVMAGAALLSASVVAIASDTAERAHTYIPMVADGTARIYDDPTAAAAFERLVPSVAPSVVVVHPGFLVTAASDASGPQPTGPGRIVQAQRTGCTWAQSRPTESAYPGPECTSVSNDLPMGGNSTRTAPARELATLLHLDEAQTRAVHDGALVVPDRRTIPAEARPGTFDALRPAQVDVMDGSVRFWVAEGISDGNGQFTQSAPPTTTTLPALLLPWDQFLLGQSQNNSGSGAYLATETATRLGWAQQPDGIQLVDPSGPIDQATQQRLQTALSTMSEHGQVAVERGFERDDTRVVLVLMGIIGLIILVATFVSTALSMAEQLPMMGTLAAVGATRMTRRKLAAAQAFHLSGLGALVGAAIGVLPGIAAARTITVRYTSGFTPDSASELVGPFVEIPWLQVVAPVLAIPLIAAAFAFVSIRRAPVVTRRAT